jgi:hypothetical protein
MTIAFAARLEADANAALDELQIDMTHWAKVKLRAVTNTERVLVGTAVCAEHARRAARRPGARRQ